MRKYIVLILIFFLFMPKTFANVHSNQRLQAQLGEVLHIEKIICENSEYNKDEELKNVQIKNVEQVNSECYKVSFSPFVIRITTNLKEPIQVSARFDDCCSACGRYPLKGEDLFITPTSYIINDPYDKIETDFFTPEVLIHENTIRTTYRAKLLITLGRV